MNGHNPDDVVLMPIDYAIGSLENLSIELDDRLQAAMSRIPAAMKGLPHEALVEKQTALR